MYKKFKCINGHDITIDLPDSFFKDSSLILPCPECKERYLISKDGEVELFNNDPYHKLSFTAMHY